MKKDDSAAAIERQNKRIIRFVCWCIAFAVLVIYSATWGGGSSIAFVGYLSGFGLFFVAALFISRHPHLQKSLSKSLSEPVSAARLRKQIPLVFLVLIIFSLPILWAGGGFDYALHKLLSAYGEGTYAQVESYDVQITRKSHLYRYQVEIRYDNHVNTIQVTSDNSSYNPTVQNVIEHKPIRVHYIKWAPFIVQPDDF